MKRLLLKGTFVAYLLIGLEIFIMISPFAAYFYSLYAPAIKLLYSTPATGWLAEFFLPHFLFPEAPFLKVLGGLQLVTFFVGLGLFFTAALPLYYAKFRKRGVVSKGIYCHIRHPQYLGLGIAGFGLLLYWPRFIILVTYLTMLFLYNLLARNEEQRMLGSHGESYRQYMETVPMFLPGGKGERIFRPIERTLGSRAAAMAVLYLSVLLLSLGTALLVRSYSIGAIPMADVKGVAVVSVLPMAKSGMEQLVGTAMDSRKSDRKEAEPTMAYIMPSDFFLMALVTDLERLYPPDFEKPAGGSTVVRFVKIFINYTRVQLGLYRDENPIKRIIFISVQDKERRPLHGRAIFSIGSQRYPLFHADVDSLTGQVLSYRDLMPRHKWGELPMPIF
ncbi:MAG: isoprenylcysteine carboxylmethyltransferase family protein [Thermodesulfovibrionales bacterium]|jgi:protein-S-isoprenylcysteine O-methyltransferase Ste14